MCMLAFLVSVFCLYVKSPRAVPEKSVLYVMVDHPESQIENGHPNMTIFSNVCPTIHNLIHQLPIKGRD